MIDVFETGRRPRARCRARPGRSGLELRHRRHRHVGQSRQGHLSRSRSRRKTAAQRSAVEPCDHRTLPADARHLSGAPRNCQRSDRRNSAHQRTAQAASAAEDLRVRNRRLRATTRATSSATCRRSCTSRCGGPTCASRSAPTSAPRTSSAAARSAPGK